MDLSTWLAFVVTECALCLSPGPAVILVVGHAVSRGPRTALWSTIGILAANALYFSITAAGLGTLLLASHTLFSALKWAGVVYLGWLGLRLLTTTHSAAAPTAPAPPRGPARVILDGAVLQLANPKALVFFAALLSPFVDARGDVPRQFLILGATSIALELGVLVVYAWLAARGARHFHHASAWPRRVGGLLLLAASAALARVELDRPAR